jgi:hypothetical protein
MPLACRKRAATEGTREAEHSALAVHLTRLAEERVGYVLGAQRVAGEEAGLGVVAGLGTEMDRHGEILSELG